MPLRNRTMTRDPQVGYTRSSNGSVNISSRDGLRKECTDVIGEMFGVDGNLKDHQFNLTTVLQQGNVINARRDLGGGDWISYENRINTFPARLPEVTVSSGLRGQFFVRLLASTGPLTPKVNLPLFIFELKDIPLMLKHAGDLLHKIREPSRLSPAKEAAAANLAYQFGWAPLVGDILKLLDFEKHVMRRQIELSKANSRRGLKRRMPFLDVPPSLMSHDDDVLLSSVAGNVRGSVTKTSSTRAWATVRWKVKSGQSYGKLATHNEAFRSALGLNLGMIPITVWKALPWSWMIDWFADISNTLQANYNMIYYNASSACFMEQRTQQVWTSGGTNSIGSLSAGYWRRDVKIRTPLSTSTSVNTLRVPFLDTFKLSILSSLTIQSLYNWR